MEALDLAKTFFKAQSEICAKEVTGLNAKDLLDIQKLPKEITEAIKDTLCEEIGKKDNLELYVAIGFFGYDSRYDHDGKLLSLKDIKKKITDPKKRKAFIARKIKKLQELKDKEQFEGSLTQDQSNTAQKAFEKALQDIELFTEMEKLHPSETKTLLTFLEEKREKGIETKWRELKTEAQTESERIDIDTSKSLEELMGDEKSKEKVVKEIEKFKIDKKISRGANVLVTFSNYSWELSERFATRTAKLADDLEKNFEKLEGPINLMLRTIKDKKESAEIKTMLEKIKSQKNIMAKLSAVFKKAADKVTDEREKLKNKVKDTFKGVVNGFNEPKFKELFSRKAKNKYVDCRMEMKKLEPVIKKLEEAKIDSYNTAVFWREIIEEYFKELPGIAKVLGAPAHIKTFNNALNQKFKKPKNFKTDFLTSTKALVEATKNIISDISNNLKDKSDNKNNKCTVTVTINRKKEEVCIAETFVDIGFVLEKFNFSGEMIMPQLSKLVDMSEKIRTAVLPYKDNENWCEKNIKITMEQLYAFYEKYYKDSLKQIAESYPGIKKDMEKLLKSFEDELKEKKPFGFQPDAQWGKIMRASLIKICDIIENTYKNVQKEALTGDKVVEKLFVDEKVLKNKTDLKDRIVTHISKKLIDELDIKPWGENVTPSNEEALRAMKELVNDYINEKKEQKEKPEEKKKKKEKLVPIDLPIKDKGGNNITYNLDMEDWDKYLSSLSFGFSEKPEYTEEEATFINNALGEKLTFREDLVLQNIFHLYDRAYQVLFQAMPELCKRPLEIKPNNLALAEFLRHIKDVYEVWCKKIEKEKEPRTKAPDKFFELINELKTKIKLSGQALKDYVIIKPILKLCEKFEKMSETPDEKFSNELDEQANELEESGNEEAEEFTKNLCDSIKVDGEGIAGRFEEMAENPKNNQLEKLDPANLSKLFESVQRYKEKIRTLLAEIHEDNNDEIWGNINNVVVELAEKITGLGKDGVEIVKFGEELVLSLKNTSQSDLSGRKAMLNGICNAFDVILAQISQTFEANETPTLLHLLSQTRCEMAEFEENVVRRTRGSRVDINLYNLNQIRKLNVRFWQQYSSSIQQGVNINIQEADADAFIFQTTEFYKSVRTLLVLMDKLDHVKILDDEFKKLNDKSKSVDLAKKIESICNVIDITDIYIRQDIIRGTDIIERYFMEMGTDTDIENLFSRKKEEEKTEEAEEEQDQVLAFDRALVDELVEKVMKEDALLPIFEGQWDDADKEDCIRNLLAEYVKEKLKFRNGEKNLSKNIPVNSPNGKQLNKQILGDALVYDVDKLDDAFSCLTFDLKTIKNRMQGVDEKTKEDNTDALLEKLGKTHVVLEKEPIAKILNEAVNFLNSIISVMQGETPPTFELYHDFKKLQSCLIALHKKQKYIEEGIIPANHEILKLFTILFNLPDMNRVNSTLAAEQAENFINSFFSSGDKNQQAEGLTAIIESIEHQIRPLLSGESVLKYLLNVGDRKKSGKLITQCRGPLLKHVAQKFVKEGWCMKFASELNDNWTGIQNLWKKEFYKDLGDKDLEKIPFDEQAFIEDILYFYTSPQERGHEPEYYKKVEIVLNNILINSNFFIILDDIFVSGNDRLLLLNTMKQREKEYHESEDAADQVQKLIEKNKLEFYGLYEISELPDWSDIPRDQREKIIEKFLEICKVAVEEDTYQLATDMAGQHNTDKLEVFISYLEAFGGQRNLRVVSHLKELIENVKHFRQIFEGIGENLTQRKEFAENLPKIQKENIHFYEDANRIKLQGLDDICGNVYKKHFNALLSLKHSDEIIKFFTDNVLKLRVFQRAPFYQKIQEITKIEGDSKKAKAIMVLLESANFKKFIDADEKRKHILVAFENEIKPLKKKIQEEYNSLTELQIKISEREQILVSRVEKGSPISKTRLRDVAQEYYNLTNLFKQQQQSVFIQKGNTNLYENVREDLKNEMERGGYIQPERGAQAKDTQIDEMEKYLDRLKKRIEELEEKQEEEGDENQELILNAQIKELKELYEEKRNELRKFLAEHSEIRRMKGKRQKKEYYTKTYNDHLKNIQAYQRNSIGVENVNALGYMWSSRIGHLMKYHYGKVLIGGVVLWTCFPALAAFSTFVAGGTGILGAGKVGASKAFAWSGSKLASWYAASSMEAMAASKMGVLGARMKLGALGSIAGVGGWLGSKSNRLRNFGKFLGGAVSHEETLALSRTLLDEQIYQMISDVRTSSVSEEFTDKNTGILEKMGVSFFHKGPLSVFTDYKQLINTPRVTFSLFDREEKMFNRWREKAEKVERSPRHQKKREKLHKKLSQYYGEEAVDRAEALGCIWDLQLMMKIKLDGVKKGKIDHRYINDVKELLKRWYHLGADSTRDDGVETINEFLEAVKDSLQTQGITMTISDIIDQMKEPNLTNAFEKLLNTFVNYKVNPDANNIELSLKKFMEEGIISRENYMVKKQAEKLENRMEKKDKKFKGEEMKILKTALEDDSDESYKLITSLLKNYKIPSKDLEEVLHKNVKLIHRYKVAGLDLYSKENKFILEGVFRFLGKKNVKSFHPEMIRIALDIARGFYAPDADTIEKFMKGMFNGFVDFSFTEEQNIYSKNAKGFEAFMDYLRRIDSSDNLRQKQQDSWKEKIVTELFEKNKAKLILIPNEPNDPLNYTLYDLRNHIDTWADLTGSSKEFNNMVGENHFGNVFVGVMSFVQTSYPNYRNLIPNYTVKMMEALKKAERKTNFKKLNEQKQIDFVAKTCEIFGTYKSPEKNVSQEIITALEQDPAPKNDVEILGRLFDVIYDKNRAT